MTATTATAEQEPRAAPPLVNEEGSAYRQMDKRYRVRRVAVNTRQTRFVRVEPEMDSLEVLDFQSPNIDADPRVRQLGPEEADMRALFALGGGQEGEEKACPRVYALRDRPGFFYISAALISPKVQARWARTCLARFSRQARSFENRCGRMHLNVARTRVSMCVIVPSHTHTHTDPGTPT